MNPVYKKFDNHFQDVSAYTVLRGDAYVGKIVFKHTKAGVVHAYVQEYGHTMVAGKASGYGYDKVEAALEDAVSIVTLEVDEELAPLYKDLQSIKGDGEWKRMMTDKGYRILHAI